MVIVIESRTIHDSNEIYKMNYVQQKYDNRPIDRPAKHSKLMQLKINKKCNNTMFVIIPAIK